MGSLVDLFAGCGGMSYGLERAGFGAIYVNELNPHAMDTYVRNQPADSLVRDPHLRSNDIFELTGDDKRLSMLAEELREIAGGDVDLVAGGPPCQGFSGIGHRRSFDLEKESIPSNHLYREMAAVISAVQPKAFVFENVQGLLHARWTKVGRSGEIWDAVRSEFERVRFSQGGRYLVKAHLVHSKNFGVPQNRPRIILIGVRPDVAESSGYRGDWLPDPEPSLRPPDPSELLGDLCESGWTPGGATAHYPTDPLNEVQRELRTRRDGSVMGKGEAVTEQEFSRHSERVQERFSLIRRGLPVPTEMQTRKFNQRPIPSEWPASGPSLTVASLPDDFVHYKENRAPTVREWARFQGFPDWYEFSGPRTTGGRRRAGDPDAGQWERDLPKFTQIGNAVPVALAHWLGVRLKAIIG